MSKIVLNDILNIKEEDFSKWVLCLNNAKQGDNIYSFSEDYDRLMEHISWKKNKDTEKGKGSTFRLINTPYCLQFLRMDNKSYEYWLFLGAYEKNKNNEATVFPDGHEVYNLNRLSFASNLIERLVIRYKKKPGNSQSKISIELIKELEVIEILDRPYINISKPFEGYNNVRLMFKDLKSIVNSNVDSWRVSLSNIFAIYIITDVLTGKIYVGSAYGKEGLWQRWSTYVNTNGTGGNKELDLLISNDKNYANNFQFSILEVMTDKKMSQEYVNKREDYWKEVLCSRDKGLNDN